MNLQKKSVLIIGAGVMAEEYAKALSELKIKNVTILGNSIKKTQNLAKKYGYYLTLLQKPIDSSLAGKKAYWL